MKFIPYKEDMFHLPYKDLDAIKKDFFNVSIDENENEAIIFGSIKIGKVEYDIFIGGDSAEQAVAEFNKALETRYIPKFRAKYSNERL